MDRPVISRALVVEGHPSLRGSLTRSLALRLPEVRSCAPGEEVERLLVGFRPELVLVDARSLDEEWLRGLGESAPVPILIVMTDREPTPDRWDRIHVQKPLTAERLDSALEAGRRLRGRAG